MKLLIVPSWYPTNIHPESGTFFRDRAKILQQCGFSITIATHILHSTKDILKFKQNDNDINPEVDDGVVVYKTESINPFPKMPNKTFNHYKKLILSLVKNVINISKPEFVFINSSLYGGAALAKYLHSEMIPFMVSEHLKEFILKNQFSLFQKECINECYNYSSKIITTSKVLKNEIINNFNINSKRVLLIPNPADTKYFLPKRSKTGDTFTFISVALLRPEKRLDILIKAFAILSKHIPNIVLTVIGDGPEKNKLKLLSHKLGVNNRINFIGYQNKIAVSDILRDHDALVLSSEVETFGVVIVEAMSVGLPVIATKCGGPESIVVAETGVLVDSNDKNKLSVAMKNMIEDYNNYDSNTIRQIAINIYGDKAYGDNIMNAIDSVLSAKD
ncbi:MAG: glycosyltransferase [Candidatus Marinimicrobia bacterium]|jgi:glycosyltransferase involved in cell wall biosynthesis|nr:glycosyltransferase [Candidatus Neomarinimicrobiota bacterium]